LHPFVNSKNRMSCRFLQSRKKNVANIGKDFLATNSINGKSIGRKVVNNSFSDDSKASSENSSDEPSSTDLRKLFVYSAVPMIGFGFTDNLVMILAGDAIDSTIGVKFALSTLAAAALGQCVSDMTGVLFGSTVEAMATKLGLPMPMMTARQRQARISKFAAMSGSCLGVLCGCLLGMTSLLFLNTKETEKKKHFQHVNTVYSAFMLDGQRMIGCDYASCLVVDKEKGTFWSRYAMSTGGDVLEFSLDQGIAGLCRKNRKLIHVEDAYTNPMFSKYADEMTGLHTKNMLSCPVIDSQGDVIAVIQLLNKEGGFTKEDEKLATMLARHMAICEEVLE